MQYNPTKVGFNYQGNTYGNQYPPHNQPQFGAINNYQSYQTPPPAYPAYPQPPFANTGYITPGVQYYGQTALYPQPNVFIVPTHRSFWMNQILATMTPRIRVFFIISGILYLIWSLSAIGLEIVLIIESYSTYYRGVWAGGVLLAGGICMLTMACRTSYSTTYMIRLFILVLLFCIFGLVLSAVNYGTSTKCLSSLSYRYSCDQELVTILKIVILVVFVVATAHTLINIFVVNNEHKKAMLKATAPRAPNH